MRFVKTMLASAGLLLASVATAVAAPLALLQDPPIKVEVSTSESRTVWYTDPMWLAIGGVVILLIIVLAVMAARNRKGTTTVIK